MTLRRAPLTGIVAVCAPLFSTGILHAGLFSRQVDAVAVSSRSTPEYAAQKFASNPPKRETYLFFQGTFHGGTVHDIDLDRTSFSQITKVLAENLAKQNYYPSTDIKDADLFITVQWGTTTIADIPNLEADQEELTKQSYFAMLRQPTSALFTTSDREELARMVQNKYGDYDGGSVEGAAAAVESDREEVLKQVNVNAKLLGYDTQLARTQAEKGAGSTDEITLVEELVEERFFVILQAYDYRTMKKGTPPKLLWTTRFSIRATGNLFSTSVPVLGKAASKYFGRNLDELKREDDVPSGNVDVGQPKVVSDGKK